MTRDIHDRLRKQGKVRLLKSKSTIHIAAVGIFAAMVFPGIVGLWSISAGFSIY